MELLNIKDLHVKTKDTGQKILNGVNLTLNKGEVHAIMGPNGSGKSTLANAIMGNPSYEIISGEILLEGEDITALTVDERAKKGIFLSFQQPQEIPGIKLRSFMISARQHGGSKEPILKISREIDSIAKEVSLDKEFLNRYLNVGFSGGEKKKSEILQMRFLNPRVAILDEIDSGLDVDALKVIAEAINSFRGGDMAILLITHYQRLLDYIEPDHVHVYIDGKVVISDGPELAKKVETEGYGSLIENSRR